MPLMLTRKRAAMGGEQDAPFEQSLAALGYSTIKDKAPGLLKHLVAFQLVEKHDDKSVGVFGFRPAQEWMYVPLFFLNGKLKGYEMLFLRDQDLVCPTKENWIQYLLRQNPNLDGEPSQDPLQTINQRNRFTPDIRPLVTPQYTQKRGAAPRDAAPAWVPLATVPGHGPGWLQQSLRTPRPSISLETLLTKDADCLEQAAHWYETEPAFRFGINRFYGGADFFWKCAKTLKQARAQRAKEASAALLLQAPAALPLRPVSLLCPEPHPLQSGLLRLEVLGQHKTAGLDDATKARLLRDKFAVQDRRPPNMVSPVYREKEEHALATPDREGVYQGLVEPGTFEKIVVLTGIRNPDPYRRPIEKAIVLQPDGGRYAMARAYPTDIVIDGREIPNLNDWTDWVEGLPDISTKTLTPGKAYVAITPRGTASVPFEIRSRITDDSYLISWVYGAEVHSFLGDRLNPNNQPRYPGTQTSGEPMLIINRPRDASITATDNILYVPPNVKVVELAAEDIDQPTFDQPASGPFKPVAYKEVRLATAGAIQNLLFDKLASIAVERVAEHGPYRLVEQWPTLPDRQPHFALATKQAVILHLVGQHGMTEADARRIVTAVDQEKTARFFVKHAAPFWGSPLAPPHPEQDMRSSDIYSPGLNSTTKDEQHVDAGLQERYGPSRRLINRIEFPQLLQTVQQAAQQGDKDFFDLGSFASLLKTKNLDNMGGDVLPALIAAMDKVGRVKIDFLWRGSDFEERYGKQEMPELGDSLDNVFESLGDLVLFLKEKTTQTSPASLLESPNLDHAAEG